MTRHTLTALAAVGLLTAGACSQEEQASESAQPEANAAASGEAEGTAEDTMQGSMENRAGSASGTIVDNEMNERGTVTLTQGPDGVVIRIEADGLAEAAWGRWHGGHLHETGDCSASDFTSAGSHINTLGNQHGLLNAQGPDNADLPNLWVHEGGVLRAEVYTTRVSLDGQTEAPALLGGDGSALIIHTNSDDHASQPIGGAGARILCAVIEPAQ